MPKIGVNKMISLTGHRDAVYALSGGADAGHFYSAGADGLLVKWNVHGGPDGELITRVPNSVYSIHWLASHQEMVVGHNYDGVHFIDPGEHVEKSSLKIGQSAIFDIQSCRDYIIVGGGDGCITLIDKKSHHTIRQFRASSRSARSIAVNDRIGQYAVGFSDNFIRIYDLTDHRLLKEFEAHLSSVFTVAYSPGGEYLLSGSRDARLKIWQAGQDYTEKDSIVAHMYAINHICFSGDGSHFATCSLDKTIKLWSSEDFRLLKVIDRARHGGHATSVNRLIWPGEQTLVSCSDDRTISIWEINFD
jgi:WD40 repeat protein